MIIIAAKKGIFDASGCHIEFPVGKELTLTHLSNEREAVTTVAVFYSEVGAQEAYNDVLSAIKEKKNR